MQSKESFPISVANFFRGRNFLKTVQMISRLIAILEGSVKLMSKFSTSRILSIEGIARSRLNKTPILKVREIRLLGRRSSLRIS